MTSSTAHGYQVGDVISTTLFGDITYNRLATTVLSVPSTSSFTFNASGSDEASIVDTAGRISTGLSVATLTLPVYGYQAQTGGRGSIYTTGEGLMAGIYGGSWGNGNIAGSRNFYSNFYLWRNGNEAGLRGRSDHLVVP